MQQMEQNNMYMGYEEKDSHKPDHKSSYRT